MKAVTNLVVRVDKENALHLNARLGTLSVDGDLKFTGEITTYEVTDKKVPVKPSQKKYLLFESGTLLSFENESYALIIPPEVKGREVDEEEFTEFIAQAGITRYEECVTGGDCDRQFGPPPRGMIWACIGHRCLLIWP